MNIIMHVLGMPFNGATINDGKSLGGSETAAYYMALKLSAKGHNVIVFTKIKSEEGGVWDGVRYLSVGETSQNAPLGREFDYYAATVPHDVLIIQRNPMGFHRQYASKINLWWAHDLALKRQLPHLNRQMWNVDQVLVVSEYHKKQMVDVFDIPQNRVTVIRNGIDLSLYTPPTDTKTKREGKVLVYSSRPERGLINLVRPDGIMDKLQELDPDITLKVCGYDNTTRDMAPLYETLWQRCRELPNVELLGALSKTELAQLMKTAWLHVYPTEFEEVSCITAMEEQAAGTPFITNGGAALPETLANGGGVWVEKPEDFPKKIIELRDNPVKWGGLHIKALTKSADYSWSRSVDALEKLIEKLFRSNTSNKQRLATHFLRNSDIYVLKHRRIGNENIKNELATHYAFMNTDSWQENADIYAEWAAENDQEHGHERPEIMLGTPRFAAVVNQITELSEGSEVLDFACGQGHFTIAMAQKFPKLNFLGVDIAEAALEVGQKRIAELKLENIVLEKLRLIEMTEGFYDFIAAMEIMEHVPAPWTLADQLEKLLKPDGVLCITTPFGPWEAASFDKLPVRAHVHHLERADLKDMWEHKTEYQTIVLPTQVSKRGETMGCYLTTFKPGGKRSGTIDLARKARMQAPRETLSACLIVKPDGDSLAKCLRSIAGVVDEIIVGIDCGDSVEFPVHGRAKMIAEDFGAVVIPIKSPLQTGFDEARNTTTALATGDWILWIDDDEVLEWPERLHKYLRPNGYEGYAIKQIHQSVEPEGVLKVDFPCRVYRNRPGVQFYGVVHEHPESKMNKGLHPVLTIPDIAICHHGYDTEAIRRERFQRNLPLMVRDREKYPERILGKFLWIRDLVHTIRYEREQGVPTSQHTIDAALEAVKLWRELLDGGFSRMAKDALPYYSEAVDTLTQGQAIEFEVSMAASHSVLGGLNGVNPEIIRGHFLTPEDVKMFTDSIYKEKTNIFEGVYF